MTDKTDNELIHEFMGHDWKTGTFSWRPGVYDPMKLEHLEYYQKSWDWLMPVVEKIEAIDVDDLILEIRYKLCHIEYDEFGIRNFKGETKIEAVYKAIIEFIKWYNKDSNLVKG